jgi:hypothetical protein
MYMKSKFDLDKIFETTGCYYKEDGVKYRSHLYIQKKNSNTKEIELLVIMMNPGGSKPKQTPDIIKKNEPVEVIPDMTQYQIMRVMDMKKINRALIINLSDLCEPKSERFYLKIIENDTRSIFEKNRIEEWKSKINAKTIIIKAWGVHYKLNRLAEMAESELNDIKNKKIGWNKVNTTKYYHPLPKSHEKQKQWVKEITKQS